MNETIGAQSLDSHTRDVKFIAPREKFVPSRARPLDDLSRVQYIFGAFTPESKIHLGLTSASVFGEL
jgi:hypothetical protein